MSSRPAAGPPSRGWARGPRPGAGPPPPPPPPPPGGGRAGPGTGQDRHPTPSPHHPTPTASIMKLAAVGEIEKAANLMIDRGQARG